MIGGYPSCEICSHRHAKPRTNDNDELVFECGKCFCRHLLDDEKVKQ